jgi:cytochrome c556
MKLKIIMAAAVLLGSAGVGHSAADPIAVRKAIMKNVGAATGAGGAMAKGEAEFNAVTAALVLRTMNTAALGFGELFPEGSETGGESTASPKIWEDRAGFNAAFAKFAADTAAGIAAKPADLDAFRAAFGAAASNCGACHKA